MPDLAGYEGRLGNESARGACQRLLGRYGIDPSSFVFGTTKVFFRCVVCGCGGVVWCGVGVVRCGVVWCGGAAAAAQAATLLPAAAGAVPCWLARKGGVAGRLAAWPDTPPPPPPLPGPACWAASRTSAPPSSAWCACAWPLLCPPAHLPSAPCPFSAPPAPTAGALTADWARPMRPGRAAANQPPRAAGHHRAHVRHLLALAHLVRQAAPRGAGHAGAVAGQAGAAQAGGAAVPPPPAQALPACALHFIPWRVRTAARLPPGKPPSLLAPCRLPTRCQPNPTPCHNLPRRRRAWSTT